MDLQRDGNERVDQTSGQAKRGRCELAGLGGVGAPAATAGASHALAPSDDGSKRKPCPVRGQGFSADGSWGIQGA
jgi:hypothetical protein